MIRRAKPKDLEGLLKLYDHLKGDLAWAVGAPMKVHPAHKRALAQIIKDPRQHVLVHEARGKVAGACSLYLLPRVYGCGRPWALLDAVVVDPGARGKGVGRKLIQHAIRLARLHGCAEVDLAAVPRFKRAQMFYENLGFEVVSVGMRLKF